MRELRWIVAAILVLTVLLRAQTTQPAESVGSPMIESRMTDLEADIGRLMQRRVDSSNAALRELELRIDARLVARWLLARAAAAPSDSDLRHIAWIRASDVLSGIAIVEQELDAGGKNAGPIPAAAKSLNDLTFKLGDMKSADPIDTVCRTTASAISPAADWPVMRPAVKVEAWAGRSIEELAAGARGLNVSPALRAQLLALSQKAVEIAKDPKRQGEIVVIREILDSAVTLAEGLQVNTGVEREDRVQMESQIAQGLAMALDPRTRELGQKRVGSLNEYRRLLTRVREMKLSPDLVKRFGPAFLWAQKNPGESEEFVKVLELFLSQDARLAAISPKTELTAPYAKPADDARRRAVAARQAFIDGVASASQFRRPTSIKRQAETLERAMDGRAAIARMPEVMKAINALRPKPFGGIDKRVQSALAAWQPDTREPDRDVATHFMTQLGKLADFATEPADSTAISGKYTGGTMDAFRTRRKAILSEIVNAVAGGGALDDMALAPIEAANGLVSSARLGMKAEEASANAEVLQRWVDWGVGPAQINALLDPYRIAMAAAFKGFAESDLYQLKEWENVRKRYEPVLSLVVRIAERGEECRALPSGRVGAAAKLATPVVGQPYATERAARFGIDVWFHSVQAKEEKRANATLEALGVILAK